MKEASLQENLTDILAQLYIDDQRDRLDRLYEKNPSLFEAHDKERLDFVLSQVDRNTLKTPADRFHAAMILQHGNCPEHFKIAHELALSAAQAGYNSAPDEADPYWLAAATYDRWLMSLGKPQRYGTQYQRRSGVWHLYDVDPATTDEERIAAHAPSLAEAETYTETLNQRDRAAKRSEVDP